jgi:uncharacterized protein YbbC (DUF1343 family)
MSRRAMMDAGFPIKKLFSPEHGINIAGADGTAQNNSLDEITGLPVISLYGQKLKPSEEDLRDIALVIVDIPDIGCRFYTYLWTMTYVMEACQEQNKPLIILDRPNPLGALLSNAEGPFLNETACSSFIGRWNIPIKHCCTLGELALYFAATKMPALNIQVIKVGGYQRHHTARHDFLFTPTSPAIQNIETAMLYPGMGLLEGIHINEGRGTQTPFTKMGAPWIHSHELLTAWNDLGLQGLEASACTYIPAESLYMGETCYGLNFRISGSGLIKPVASGIELIKLLMNLYPKHTRKRPYPTIANPEGTNHLDKLLGVSDSYTCLKNNQEINTDIAGTWREMIRDFLLYP